MSKLITFLILFYLIYKGSRWLLKFLSVPGNDQTQVKGQDRAQPKLNIDKRDIEDADYKDINND